MTQKDLNLVCKFTNEDLREMGDRLAEIPLLIEGEDSKCESYKDRAKACKNKIETLQVEQLALAKKYESGEETRPVPCQIDYDVPESGKKTITREDTGEIWEENMTEADMNLFKDEPPAEEAVEEVHEGTMDGIIRLTDEQIDLLVKADKEYGIDFSEVPEIKDVFICKTERDLEMNGMDGVLFIEFKDCFMIKTRPQGMVTIIKNFGDRFKGTVPVDEETGFYWFGFCK